MTKDQLLGALKANPFVLAPMAGITDCAFRTFMRELGAGIVVSELVSAHGLNYNSPRTRRLMDFEESQRPVGIQIFGEEESSMATAAKIVEETGADFVDINFGCPVPKVVKKGAGAAVLKDTKKFSSILKAVHAAVKIPVTIKIRTGWDESSRNAKELADIAFYEGITWVAIHGRTRAAGYSGRADWDFIANVKQNALLPIIGNGDIASAQGAVDCLTQSQCDGVMIGRGCLKNPWIFKQAMTLYLKQQNLITGGSDILDLISKLKTHLSRNNEEKIVTLQLKKFSAWYCYGYPGAAHFRRDLFAHHTLADVHNTICKYFASVQSLAQQDTSSEPFLMGGHG